MNAGVKIRKGVPALVGTYDGNLKLFEQCFQVSAHLGPESLEIEGEEPNIRRAQRMVEEYATLVERGTKFEHAEIEGFLKILCQDPSASLKGLAEALTTFSPYNSPEHLSVDLSRPGRALYGRIVWRLDEMRYSLIPLALQASKNAKTWTWASVALGLVVAVVQIMLIAPLLKSMLGFQP